MQNGLVEGDVVQFKTASKTTTDGAVTMVDYGNTIDAFAVYCNECAEYYWVSIDEAGSKSTYLRLTDPKIDHPHVNRATEFTFDSKLPTLDTD